MDGPSGVTRVDALTGGSAVRHVGDISQPSNGDHT
jgi:hypothetical protein